MGDWTKIIWDKLPMFFGQLMLQNYLEDPSISFCAIGDAADGVAPLQVCNFAQGGALDREIGKIWTFQAGGGNEMESYDLAAFYYAYMVDLPVSQVKPFFFFTGDEGVYPEVHTEWLASKLGVVVEKAPTIQDLFRDLRTKYNVFLLYKPYSIESKREQIYKSWESLIGGEAILELADPRAIVDTMLGAIALVSGSRTMESYMADMTTRGQSEDRKNQVSGLLANMSDQYGNVTATDGDRAVHNGLRYSIEHASSYQAAPGDGPDEAALMRAELARANAELAALQAGDAEPVQEAPPPAAPDGQWSCAACTMFNANNQRAKCQSIHSMPRSRPSTSPRQRKLQSQRSQW